MASRLELHTKLVKILGTKNVYYQPPENIKLQYPCILYELNNISLIYSNNTPYKHNVQYTVTLIHRDPDNTIINELLKLEYCEIDRTYKTNNLYHYVFTLYY